MSPKDAPPTPPTEKLAIFDFEDHPVRVIEREGALWFLATDVCRVLEIGNPAEAVRNLEDDERLNISNTDIGTGGSPKGFTAINESGLYSIIFRSRKPKARKFRRWVTDEVLPTIRKTGRYELNRGADDVQTFTIPDFLVQHTADWSQERRLSFGRRVRTYAYAMGIAYQTTIHPQFGKCIIFPGALLLHVAEEQKTLIASVGNIRTAEEELKRRTGSN